MWKENNSAAAAQALGFGWKTQSWGSFCTRLNPPQKGWRIFYTYNES